LAAIFLNLAFSC